MFGDAFRGLPHRAPSTGPGGWVTLPPILPTYPRDFRHHVRGNSKSFFATESAFECREGRRGADVIEQPCGRRAVGGHGDCSRRVRSAPALESAGRRSAEQGSREAVLGGQAVPIRSGCAGWGRRRAGWRAPGPAPRPGGGRVGRRRGSRSQGRPAPGRGVGGVRGCGRCSPRSGRRSYVPLLHTPKGSRGKRPLPSSTKRLYPRCREGSLNGTLKS